jgi:NADH-quinone oxidoreductase subunit M
MPMFPLATWEVGPLIGWLAVVGIIFGALMAYVQDDVKKLVAYSSVSHLGFVVMGLLALNARGSRAASTR